MPVECKLCGRELEQITWSHLKYYHSIEFVDYYRMFPGRPVTSDEARKANSVGHIEFLATLPFEERQDRTKQMNSREANEKKGRAAKAWWASLTLEEKDTKLREGINSEQSRAKAEESIRELWGYLSEEEKSRRVSHMRMGISPGSMSQATKRVWAERSQEERQRLMGPLTRAAMVGTKPTKPEKCLEEFLDIHYPGMFKLNQRGDVRIGRRYPDFISTNGRKIVIESFGVPWHTYSRTEDEIVAEYRKLGYNCIVVWANYEEDIIFEWPNIVRQIDSIGV